MNQIIERATGFIFSLICHQQSDLLIQKGDRAIQLCPRCIGMELGFALSFFFGILILRHHRSTLNRNSVLLLSGMIAIMLLDFLRGSFGFSSPTVFTRLTTGSFCGIASGTLAAWYLQYLKDNTVKHENGRSLHLLIIASGLVGLIWLTVLVSDWITLTLILDVVVLLNLLVAVFIFSLFIRSRFIKWSTL